MLLRFLATIPSSSRCFAASKDRDLSRVVVGKVRNVAGDDPLLQQLLALLQGSTPQVETVEIEKIERVVDDRRASTRQIAQPWQGGAFPAGIRALLHQAE